MLSIPDPETAPVVQYIFSLCVAGKGPLQIAKQLKKDNILTPGCYYHQKYGVLLKEVNIEEPYNWFTNSIFTHLRSCFAPTDWTINPVGSVLIGGRLFTSEIMAALYHYAWQIVISLFRFNLFLKDNDLSYTDFSF